MSVHFLAPWSLAALYRGTSLDVIWCWRQQGEDKGDDIQTWSICSQIVMHFKRVHFMVCDLYINFLKKKVHESSTVVPRIEWTFDSS
jgi:hypothetical protein